MTKDYVIVASVDLGVESVSSHQGDSAEGVFAAWAIESADFFGFAEELDYVQKEKPLKIGGLIDVWRVSFVYGSENLQCIVTIIGRGQMNNSTKASP